MTTTPLLNCATTAESVELAAGGTWTAAHAKTLEELI